MIKLNFKIISIIFSIFFLATIVCAASSITDFNINNGASYTTSDSVTLYHTITADANCEMCFSADNNSQTCTEKVVCATGTSDFAIPLPDGTKTVYAFVYDNSVFSSTASDTIVMDTNVPVCSITSPTTTDLNTTSVTFSYNCQGADYNIAKIDSNVITSGTNLSAYLTANVYSTITIDANDLAGNTMTQVSMDIIYDTNAPTAGTISADSTWTNDDKPTFSISATHHAGTTGMKMSFSCTNASGDTNWTSWITYATSYTDFNINSSTYGCVPSDWNKSIYIKFKDAAGNIDGNRYRATQLYDISDPSAPTSLSASAGNAKVTLSWTTPELDSRSGNESLKIYMKKDTGSYSLKTTLNDENDTSEEITGLVNGSEYCFKMTTVDRAGNESDYSNSDSSVCTTPSTATAAISIQKNNSSSNTDYAKNGDSINIECTYSADVSGAKIVAKAYSPTSNEDVLEDSSSSTDFLEYDYEVNFSNAQDRIVFWCEASSIGDSSTRTVYIDNTAPSVSWLDTNNTFVGMKRVLVKASDNKYFDKVEFDFNKVIYSSSKDSDNNYYFDINSVKFENGTYTIKAIVYDRAGNKTEITRNATFENTQTPKQKAEKAINDAKAKQKTANDLINYFETESLIVPQALTTKKVNADNLLNTAISTLTSSPESALTSATQAIALYDEFNKTAKVETTETKNYTMDSNNLAADLIKLGFSEEQTLSAINYITSTNITRKLIVVKAGDEAKRQVKIEISFTNDTNETLLKVIEIIPKELVDSAKKIVSDANFRIIQEDPIIEFSVPAQKGAKVTLSYGIGEVTTEVANKMIADEVVAKFTNPPILVENTVKTEEVVSKALFSGTLTIAIILLIILVIIAIIGATLFLKFRHPKDGHGFGEEKTIVEHLSPPKEEEKPKWSAP